MKCHSIIPASVLLAATFSITGCNGNGGLLGAISGDETKTDKTIEQPAEATEPAKSAEPTEPAKPAEPVANDNPVNNETDKPQNTQNSEAEAVKKQDEPVNNDQVNSITGSWQIKLHANVPSSDAQQIGRLLNTWNDAMNQHDADAVANTHPNGATIRGTAYSVADYRDKEAKAFKKHPDFQQTPAIDVYASPLQDGSGYTLIFDETFTQGGKSTQTEIMLAVIRQGADYKINYESDISTDIGLLNKMGVKTWTSSSECIQLMGEILFKSPMFRYEYIPQNKEFAKNKSLGIGCNEEECTVYDNGRGEQHYEFDFKSMTMTEIVFDYTNSIHPKYTTQIQSMCHF